jgi:RNA polymerase sigma-70 factor (ECF subfamily)
VPGPAPAPPPVAAKALDAVDPGPTADPPPLTSTHDAMAEGFSDFYRSTWPGVARALAVALGDRDLAVDATDEAMARAYPRWSTLATYDNPGAWVYRVGLNWARSHRRRLARRLPWAHPTEELPAPVADPAVRDALLALPLKLRSVVVCRLLLDWSVDDTASALGVRPGTVQSRLHRALRSLNASLDHLR